MRRGEDEGRLVDPRKLERRGAQSQDRDPLVFLFIGDMHVPAENGKHFLLHSRVCNRIPKLIEIIR